MVAISGGKPPHPGGWAEFGHFCEREMGGWERESNGAGRGEIGIVYEGAIALMASRSVLSRFTHFPQV